MSEGSYDVALICERGHVLTDMLEFAPEKARNFCETCGAPTLSACPTCNHPIPGYHRVPQVVAYHRYERPQFCGQCGLPFPWTEAIIREWHELTEMMQGLSPEERKRLDSAIGDLVRDTPGTNRAVLTLKTLAPKLGREEWEAMRGLLVSVATAAAKQQLGI